MEDKIAFAAELSALPLMLCWIREKLRSLAISSSEKNKLEVVAEEILVNIIHYAYPNQKGSLEMVWEENFPLICMTFKDGGIPFNPLENGKSPIKSLSIDSKEIGGLGIFFIKNLVDKIEYRRENTNNVLTVTKKVF